jgi:hypothetical protein
LNITPILSLAVMKVTTVQFFSGDRKASYPAGVGFLDGLHSILVAGVAQLEDGGA